MNDVTRILVQLESGAASSAEQLLPLVYEELRRLAASRLAQENPGNTLQATALVHEAYLRLVDTDRVQRWQSRGHFFAAAAEAMRRILVERARRRRRIRHGGDYQRIDLDPAFLANDDSATEELLALDEALDRLAEKDAPSAALVKLRFFAGLTVEQAAELQGLSVRTAYRNWHYARAWLYRQITGQDAPS